MPLVYATARASSLRILTFLGSGHDLEAFPLRTSFMRQLFPTYWLHLAAALSCFSSIAVHVGFQGNLDLCLENPVRFAGIAHSLWEPHFRAWLAAGTVLPAECFDFWLRTVGLVSESALLSLGPVLEAAAFACFTHLSAPRRCRLRFRPLGSFGPLAALCVLWAGHLGFAAAAASHTHSCAVLLSFAGDPSPSSRSVRLTDTSHHHFAAGALALWGEHTAASSLLRLGSLGSQAWASEILAWPFWGTSLHQQVAPASLGAACILFLLGHHMLWLPSAGFLSPPACNALFAHHLSLAGAFLLSFGVHFSLAGPRLRQGACARWAFPWPRKASVVAHLSWTALFVGFHVLGTYVHSDAVHAFAATEKAQIIQPIVAQFLQSCALGFAQWITVLCPADFLVHHALALGIHTSLLVLLKGALDASGSLLHADKLQHGFGFACDGPGRGGTCDISSWDSVYLSSFWVLNTLGWLCFYDHWRSLASFDAFGSTGSTLSGWFRDYLWLHSGNLVHGFSSAGSQELAALAWGFLLGHLAWATSFMFLISWRGYWQELLESLLFVHLRTPVLVSTWAASFTPVALSIIQARCVGLAHFTLGFIGTFAAFLLSA